MLFELHRRHVHQCTVRPLVVVLELELFGLVPYLPYGIERKTVEHFRAIGAVEAFDVTVLGRFAWLDEPKFNGVFFGLQCELVTPVFLAVVNSDSSWLTMEVNEVVQCACDPFSRQRASDVVADVLAVIVIHHIEYSNCAAIQKAVAHEVHAPGL